MTERRAYVGHGPKPNDIPDRYMYFLCALSLCILCVLSVVLYRQVHAELQALSCRVHAVEKAAVPVVPETVNVRVSLDTVRINRGETTSTVILADGLVVNPPTMPTPLPVSEAYLEPEPTPAPVRKGKR